MKHLKQLLTLAVMIVSLTAFAESDGTTITISPNVTLPVTVKPNGRKAFILHQRKYTTTTRIADAVFHDGNGNRCHYEHATHYATGIVHHYYTVTSAYYSSLSDNDYKTNRNYNSDSSSSDFAQNLGHTLVEGSQISVDGYPCFALGVGMSRFAGEFARVKWSIGGFTSLVIQGSVGKDFIFNLPNKDKLAWNAGLGLRIGENHHDVNLNLLFGETPLCENYGLLTNVEYEYYFGDAKRYGIFGGLGVVLGDTKRKDPPAFFDFHVGVAVKLWQK